MTQGFRVTYQTMAADSEELHKAFDDGLQIATGWLGQSHPFYVDGEARWDKDADMERSPIDSDLVIGEFSKAPARTRRTPIAVGQGRSRPNGVHALAGARSKIMRPGGGH